MTRTAPGLAVGSGNPNNAEVTPSPDFHDLSQLLPLQYPFITSLRVSQQGQLLHQQDVDGLAEPPRDLQSVTKAVLAVLVGVAHQQGLLPDLHVPVLDFFPEHRTEVQDPRWQEVTLHQLLTMTGGLRSELTDESYDESWYHSADPSRFALGQPLLQNPGEGFHYSNAGYHLLGQALARATGMPLQRFAEQTLFGPLEVQVPHWEQDPTGAVFGSGGLHLTAPALHRFGALVLQRGQWEGADLIPASWIETITRPQVQGYEWMEGLPWYGMGWWPTRELDHEAWYATGFGGQYLVVFPDLQAVVSITGEVSPHPSHRQVVREQVLPLLLAHR